MSSPDKIQQVYDAGDGIFQLAPAWVPRIYSIPGRRIKLHPDDYYAYGTHRGDIDERWLASTTPARNGPDTSENEGISAIVSGGERAFLLTEAVETLQERLVGDTIWAACESWPMYSKFFDNLGPLPHHIHHRDEHIISAPAAEGGGIKNESATENLVILMHFAAPAPASLRT